MNQTKKGLEHVDLTLIYVVRSKTFVIHNVDKMSFGLITSLGLRH